MKATRKFLASQRVLAIVALVLGVFNSLPAKTAELESQVYVDAGYTLSNREPSDNQWDSKSTTATLNSPELNLLMGRLGKEATSSSRWGFQIGLQTGADVDSLVTGAPPPANEPVGNADILKHLYRGNVSYLFGDERSLRIKGGLLNSYVGYESYLAIDNPNYTRGYILDTVPYFLTGLEAMWGASETVDLGFYLVGGYNYLTRPNDVPSGGFQLNWKPAPRTRFTQNLYYGPDQEETSLEFWRFLSDSIIEWRSERFLFAAAFDYGRERQAWLPDMPLQAWSSAAIWTQWQVNRHISLALRPEILRDNDGLISGARQTIRACSATFKYQFQPGSHRIVGTMELRYDRASGPEGGFRDEPDDRLRPDQTLLLLGFQWSFDG